MSLRHADLWARGVEALSAFAEREGHSSVPRRHREGDVGLGYWVDNKRKNYRDGVLTVEQITELEAFPGWDWGPYDDRWNLEYRLLKKYAARSGNPRPMIRQAIVDGVDLGKWVKIQLSNAQKGTIAAPRRRLLEAIPGWSWEPRDPHGDKAIRWRRMASELAASLAEGRPLSRSLASWAYRRRRDWREGLLAQERADQLQAIPGWAWGPSGDGPARAED